MRAPRRQKKSNAVPIVGIPPKDEWERFLFFHAHALSQKTTYQFPPDYLADYHRLLFKFGDPVVDVLFGPDGHLIPITASQKRSWPNRPTKALASAPTFASSTSTSKATQEATRALKNTGPIQVTPVQQSHPKDEQVAKWARAIALVVEATKARRRVFKKDISKAVGLGRNVWNRDDQLKAVWAAYEASMVDDTPPAGSKDADGNIDACDK